MPWLRSGGRSFGVPLALLLFVAGAVPLTSEAQQDTSKRGAVFVATADASDRYRLAEVASAAETALNNRYLVGGINVEESPATPTEQELASVRALGTELFALLRNQPAHQIAEQHGERLREALALVSGATVPEQRRLLWRACLLRVQIVMTGSHADAPGEVAEAVSDCRRRFPEQPAIDAAWRQEIVETFKKVGPSATLQIRSEPSGCRASLYGHPVGLTPVRINVEPGAQEVVLDCEGRKSRLHRFNVEAPGRSVAIWLEGDLALRSHGGNQGNQTFLVYPEKDDISIAAQHALAFASEADLAAYFVVLHKDSELTLMYFRDGALQRTGPVSANSPPAELLSLARQMIESPATGPARSPGEGEPTPNSLPRAAMADYVIGGSAIAVGAAALAYGIYDIRHCDDDSDCSPSGLGMAALLAGNVALASAAVVLVVRPFGYWRQLQVGAGWGHVRLSGAF